MTNEVNGQDPSYQDFSDAEMQQMLEDAYDAPSMPRSLQKRVERLVEAEWAPLVEPARTPAGRLWQTRWGKAVPLAASVVLFLAIAIVVNRNSEAFTWNALLEAFDRQGVVQMEGPEGTRWLSLSEGMVSERTPGFFSVLDAQNNVFLERREGAAGIERRTLPATSRADQSAGLALAFLSAQELTGASWHQLAGARVVGEQWRFVNSDGVDQVLLEVEFESPDKKRLSLDVVLDAKSQLPVASVIPSGDAEARRALSYPGIKLSEYLKRELPSAFPVVQADDATSNAASTVARESADATDSDASKPEATKSSGVRTVDTQKPTVPSVEPAQPPMSGASSKWQPVAVVQQSGSEVAARVDQLLEELWREHQVSPASPASDAELMRRVYLDLVGRTPTVPEARAYLDDTSENRYELLVDRLLRSPDHASHLATVWRSFLIPEEVDLQAFGGVQAFDIWLAERFAGNLGYDELVRRLLLAEGRLSRSGPLLFYSAAKLDPDRLASRTARVFLGMRLECAQCHDHPFEPWSQQDFWGLAAFFAQISRPQADLETVSTLMRVHDVDHGEVQLPDTETTIAPKFLNAAFSPQPDPAASRRQQLAQWLTSADNPYFARATANRVWGQLFGKGIVDPIDDLGVQNAAKSPELLDLLAGYLVGTDFDLRELFRIMVLSRAYRLSSGDTDADDQQLDLFARMNVKTLTAEQVYDCISVATLLDTQAATGSNDFNLARFSDVNREVFLQQFRTPGGQRTEFQGGIPQALTLMNGGLIEGATGLSSSGLLKSLEAPFFTNEQRVEVLYLSTLSRRPRPDEMQFLQRFVPADARGAELREGLADILWALLNSAEFAMNH